MKSPREMQPYLGDVPDGLEPIRQPYRKHTDEPRWLERGVNVIIAIVAMVAIALLLLMFAAMFGARLSLAQSQQIKIPQACAKLAALFEAKLPETFSRIEAEAALTQINWRMILVPEARRCRVALQRELKK